MNWNGFSKAGLLAAAIAIIGFAGSAGANDYTYGYAHDGWVMEDVQLAYTTTYKSDLTDYYAADGMVMSRQVYTSVCQEERPEALLDYYASDGFRTRQAETVTVCKYYLETEGG